MADKYLLESGTFGIQLEDASGVLLLEGTATSDVFIEGLTKIEQGVVAITAAGMGGALEQ